MSGNRKLVLEVTLEKHHRPRLLVPGKPWGASLRTLRESAAPDHVIIERVAEPTEAEAKEVFRERRPKHRPKGSGMAAADAPLVAEILARPAGEAIETAARRLAHLAKGGGTFESKIRRLARRAREAAENN